MRTYALFAFVVLAACGGSSNNNITKKVGPSGGSVSHSDGTSVVIPMGALSANANITITSVNATAPAGTVLVGPAYDFGPDGTTFATPVTITLPIDATKFPAGRTAADVTIYTAQRGSTQYSALSTTLGSGTASTKTNHFTVYLPAVPAASTVLDLATASSVDLATAPPIDFAVRPSSDMATPACTPQCTTGTTSCSCTETCSGHTYVMMCSQSSSTANCFCEVDGQTQSFVPSGVTCDSLSNLEGGFFQGCAPG